MRDSYEKKLPVSFGPKVLGAREIGDSPVYPGRGPLESMLDTSMCSPMLTPILEDMCGSMFGGKVDGILG